MKNEKRVQKRVFTKSEVYMNEDLTMSIIDAGENLSKNIELYYHRISEIAESLAVKFYKIFLKLRRWHMERKFVKGKIKWTVLVYNNLTENFLQRKFFNSLEEVFEEYKNLKNVTMIIRSNQGAIEITIEDITLGNAKWRISSEESEEKTSKEWFKELFIGEDPCDIFNESGNVYGRIYIDKEDDFVNSF